MAQQQSAGGGENDLAAAAVEEREADQIFERLDLLSDGWLREIELLGCAAELRCAATARKTVSRKFSSMAFSSSRGYEIHQTRHIFSGGGAMGWPVLHPKA